MTISADTAAPAEATAVNVYQAIGGRAAIAATVEGLYGRILADPELSRFFPGGVAVKHRAYVVTILAEALGGPERYRGPDLVKAHRGLGGGGGRAPAAGGDAERGEGGRRHQGAERPPGPAAAGAASAGEYAKAGPGRGPAVVFLWYEHDPGFLCRWAADRPATRTVLSRRATPPLEQRVLISAPAGYSGFPARAA